jgi:hypothetical protein
LRADLIMPDGAASSPSPIGWSAAQPAGLAPRFLSVGQAAAYLGVSADTFLEEVALGWWPAALRRGAKGRRVTWDRLALDAAADRRSGLAAPPETDPLGTTDTGCRAVAEAAAMQGVQNVPPRQLRHQRRPPQAR